jgi:hypothetical protein
MAMKHPAMMILAVLVAVVVVSISAFPARTSTKVDMAAWDTSQPQPPQSAGVHSMVGASFHAAHASF